GARRPASAESPRERAGEVHRVRTVRMGVSGRRHLRPGDGQPGRRASLGGGAVCGGVPDQLPAVHHVRPLRGGGSHPGPDPGVRVREGVRDARGGHLREGPAAGATRPGRNRGGHRGGQVVGGLVLFWVLAPISVLSAGAMLFQRNAVHAALLLIVNFFTLALFFLMLGSPFLFVVQIIVYAGAIMVLFLFVIMLLGVDREESLRERIAWSRWLAVVLGRGLVAAIAAALHLGVGVHSMPLPAFAWLNGGG